ncbi:MAG: DUF2225 domain-containing protein [Firmicutes bacterium]|nr:DUF2225 domain-containing protein [Bacillota bacterium]
MVKFAPYDVIYHDGDQTYEMFIILTGSVEIYMEKGSKPVVIARLKQGDFFGEMSVLEEMPRSGNARALDDTILVAINRSNFEKVIHNDSELAWKIMKALSARIRTLNRELALLSQERTPSEEEDAAADNAVEIPSDHEAPAGTSAGADEAKAPAAEARETPASTRVSGPEEQNPLAAVIIDDDYYSSKLFSKEVTCPVCQEVFRTKMVRSSRLVRLGIDSDFRTRYQDFEPLWYAVWVCPVCYYANYRTDFLNLPDINRRVLKNFKDKRQKNYNPGFGSQRTLRDIIEGYRLVLDCAESIKEKDEKMGSLWLNLAWLYEDIGDEAKVTEAAEKARYYLENCYLGSGNMNPERLQKIGYLTGEMYRKLGEYAKARDFFYRSLNRRTGNPSINTLAEDQLQSLKELIAQQEAKDS